MTCACCCKVLGVSDPAVALLIIALLIVSPDVGVSLLHASERVVSRTMLEPGVSDIGAVVGSYSAAHRVDNSVELPHISCSKSAK